MTIDLGKAHDALQDAVAACGGTWRDVEFYGNIPEHEQMETAKGRRVLAARARVFAQLAGIAVSDIKVTTMPELAIALADRIEDSCIAELGKRAWTMEPPVKPGETKAVAKKSGRRARTPK